MRVIGSILLLAAAVLVVPPPAAAAATAGTATTAVQHRLAAVVATAPRMRPRTYERRVVWHTNRKRSVHDRSRLRASRCLARYAQRSADRIAANGRLTHQDLRPILGACSAWMVGENIAYGFRLPRAVVRAWMRSPGHRANILQHRYRRIGIGMARDSAGVVWVSQVFAHPR